MELVLKCEGLTRCYGGVKLANDHISFDLQRGEVHALLGENGAGKSTLMKMLYGIEQPDEGQIYINGAPVRIKNSAEAIALGIGMVHQELMLIPHLTVAENIILGQEVKGKFGTVNYAAASKQIRELSETYGLDVNPDIMVGKLTIGQRQRVEILKLLYRKADILIFDEPTALLTPQESDALFEVLGQLKALGKSIVFITHKLREVYQIADRMTVIRHGVVVGTTTPAETDVVELTKMMIGKSVSHERRTPHPIEEREVFKVQNLTVCENGDVNTVDNMSFSIRAGEVLGVAGIEGNGQTQLAQAIMGLMPVKSGSVELEGKTLVGKTTKQVRGEGVSFIPDDRQGMGLILGMKIFENTVINDYDKKPYAKSALQEDWKYVRHDAKQKMEDYSVAALDENVLIGTLSGGNQQKVIVAREVTDDCKLLIAAQPTRGVDVASADYIQSRILDAAARGCAVLLISSDLDELIKVSDRIMVIFRGQTVGVIDGDEADRQTLGKLMLGENAG